MNHTTEFRKQLRQTLLERADDVLLRLVVGPQFDEPLEFTGAQIISEAERLAAEYVPESTGRVVLLLLPHSPELFLLHIGLVLRGHIPAILAWPTSRIDAEKYQRNLVHQLRELPANYVLTLPRLVENLSGMVPYPMFGVSVANATAYEKLFPAAAIADRLAVTERPSSGGEAVSANTLFLQFSGGTTGAQKAVVVTSNMLAAQLDRLRDALCFTSEDSVVSWLPMYHDMGLIACLWMPLWHGAPSLHIGANDWVMRPELLFRYISRFQSTCCWLPNFSFSYLAQRREQMAGDYNLGSLRAWINCSEPVRYASMQRFAAAFADFGVTVESLQTCYAMAETVFAITQSELGAEPERVKRSSLHRGSDAYRELAFDLLDDVYVSSGIPLRDTELKIVGDDGAALPDLVPGEILVKTPALFHGYWGSEGFRTHSLRDGWHATGDFGFLHEGSLYIIGRYKDIVIVGGQNIFPEDVEAVANTVPRVYPGRAVAFGVEDPELRTQSLAVVAETADFDEEQATQIAAAIRNLVLATIGVAPRYVAVVPRNWVVKSTAGKISRKETRERFCRERLSPVAQEVVRASRP